MKWNFDEKSPIYLQIVKQMKGMIAAGEMKPGDKIRPVRELAMEAGVNPNTMQKALSELERENILYSKRTAGRFVADNIEGMKNMQKELIEEEIDSFIQEMEMMGLHLEEIIELLKSRAK